MKWSLMPPFKGPCSQPYPLKVTWKSKLWNGTSAKSYHKMMSNGTHFLTKWNDHFPFEMANLQNELETGQMVYGNYLLLNVSVWKSFPCSQFREHFLNLDPCTYPKRLGQATFGIEPLPNHIIKWCLMGHFFFDKMKWPFSFWNDQFVKWKGIGQMV